MQTNGIELVFLRELPLRRHLDVVGTPMMKRPDAPLSMSASVAAIARSAGSKSIKFVIHRAIIPCTKMVQVIAFHLVNARTRSTSRAGDNSLRFPRQSSGPIPFW